MYYDQNGNEITAQEIKTAVAENRAVLRWCHGNWKNVASLYLFATAEEADIEAEVDTIGECYSMADEVWSDLADSVADALRAARGTLSTS